jgi:hypothetical protein
MRRHTTDRTYSAVICNMRGGPRVVDIVILGEAPVWAVETSLVREVGQAVTGVAVVLCRELLVPEEPSRYCGDVDWLHVLPHAPLDGALCLIVLMDLLRPVGVEIFFVIVGVWATEIAVNLLQLVAGPGGSNGMIRVVFVILGDIGIADEGGVIDDLGWSGYRHCRSGVGNGGCWPNVHMLRGTLIDL